MAPSETLKSKYIIITKKKCTGISIARLILFKYVALVDNNSYMRLTCKRLPDSKRDSNIRDGQMPSEKDNGTCSFGLFMAS